MATSLPVQDVIERLSLLALATLPECHKDNLGSLVRLLVADACNGRNAACGSSAQTARWPVSMCEAASNCMPLHGVLLLQTWALGKLGCRVGKSRIDPAVSGPRCLLCCADNMLTNYAALAVAAAPVSSRFAPASCRCIAPWLPRLCPQLFPHAVPSTHPAVLAAAARHHSRGVAQPG